MSYADVELDVIRWAEARKIIQNSNIQAQARKTLEEAGELLEAATALRLLESLKSKGLDSILIDNEIIHWTRKYRDSIGDVGVTLIVGSATADVDLVECLKEAYEEIKDRKGYLKPDGTFVKVE
jgi:NTP pyrophosphatase (non-canonical NTP hydrolase)